MNSTSKTGLIPTKSSTNNKSLPEKTLVFKTIAKSAPFILKPFAGLYKPYPSGCSLLCNHPTSKAAKRLLQKAKKSWNIEGRNLLQLDEIEAIRENLRQFCETTIKDIPEIDSVPEELFRKYTETDSRPLTPAPTLASAATRASDSRRCVTPDPLINHTREKTLLVLDLRRSHSQETLSLYGGGSSLHDPPIIHIQRVPPTRRSSVDNIYPVENNRNTIKVKYPIIEKKNSPASVVTSPHNKEGNEVIEEEIRRRGKRRKKKNHDVSSGLVNLPQNDPETQIAITLPSGNSESNKISDTNNVSNENNSNLKIKSHKSLEELKIDSFLSVDILKYYRRQLNVTDIVLDTEFNRKRKVALEEALKTITDEKVTFDDLTNLQKELNIVPVNMEAWLSLPRVFSRSNVRFELPMDSRLLETLTPLNYLTDHVTISSTQKLLYNSIFNKFRDNNETVRTISGKMIGKSLNLVMGQILCEKLVDNFKNLVCWSDDDLIDFKTFCGICALCERLLAPECCLQLPNRNEDPCHEIENADFEFLLRKLHKKKVPANLKTILEGIKTL